MRKLIVFLTICIAISCSNGSENPIRGIWRISKIETQEITPTSDSSVQNHLAGIQKILDVNFGYSFFNFYADSGCIIRKGSEFSHLNWKMNDTRNTITLSSKNQFSNSEIVIKALNDSVLVLKFKPDTSIIAFSDDMNVNTACKKYIKNSECILYLNKDKFEYNDKAEDIQSYENNSWRIKPSKPETREQIKERLKASVNYSKIFLYDALIRGEKVMKKKALTAPVNIAGNGIGIVGKSQIDKEWIGIFYDQAQAMEAYKILVYAFNRSLVINKKENWVLTNIDLLEQLYKNIQ